MDETWIHNKERWYGMLYEWEKLPEFMRTKEVWPYYIKLKKRSFEIFLKRIFDFTAATMMILLLVPVFLIVALWVRFDSHGPIFYTQKRVTQYGKIFKIYKFRTMTQCVHQKGSLVTVSGDSRITHAGKWLRKYRLDELPQLINIWKGEMTFVGTRPEVVPYVRQYTKEMYATLLMPAGVTSTASIAFKDEEQMLKEGMGEECLEKVTDVNKIEDDIFDKIYLLKILPRKMFWNLQDIKNFSLFLDFKILLKTMYAIIKSN